MNEVDGILPLWQDRTMIRRFHIVGGLTLLFTIEAVVLGQAEYRYDRRPKPGEQLVYEMRTRTEGAPVELVAKLRVSPRT